MSLKMQALTVISSVLMINILLLSMNVAVASSEAINELSSSSNSTSNYSIISGTKPFFASYLAEQLASSQEPDKVEVFGLGARGFLGKGRMKSWIWIVIAVVILCVLLPCIICICLCLCVGATAFTCCAACSPCCADEEGAMPNNTQLP